MTTIIAYLQKSSNPTKKFMITINGKTVHFGAEGYSDYTQNKDPKRKKLYKIRHQLRENWTKSGIYHSGFWSRWILWSKETLQESITYIYKKFNIKIIRSSQPNDLRKSPKKSQRKSPKKSQRKSPKKLPKNK